MGGRASLLLVSLLLEDEASVPGNSSWAMAAEANKRIAQVTLQHIFGAFTCPDKWQIAFQCGCRRCLPKN
jgi:hypothetical protein